METKKQSERCGDNYYSIVEPSIPDMLTVYEEEMDDLKMNAASLVSITGLRENVYIVDTERPRNQSRKFLFDKLSQIPTIPYPRCNLSGNDCIKKSILYNDKKLKFDRLPVIHSASSSDVECPADDESNGCSGEKTYSVESDDTYIVSDDERTHKVLERYPDSFDSDSSYLVSDEDSSSESRRLDRGVVDVVEKVINNYHNLLRNFYDPVKTKKRRKCEEFASKQDTKFNEIILEPPDMFSDTAPLSSAESTFEYVPNERNSFDSDACSSSSILSNVLVERDGKSFDSQVCLISSSSQDLESFEENEKRFEYTIEENIFQSKTAIELVRSLSMSPQSIECRDGISDGSTIEADDLESFYSESDPLNSTLTENEFSRFTESDLSSEFKIPQVFVSMSDDLKMELDEYRDEPEAKLEDSQSTDSTEIMFIDADGQDFSSNLINNSIAVQEDPLSEMAHLELEESKEKYLMLQNRHLWSENDANSSAMITSEHLSNEVSILSSKSTPLFERSEEKYTEPSNLHLPARNGQHNSSHLSIEEVIDPDESAFLTDNSVKMCSHSQNCHPTSKNDSSSPSAILVQGGPSNERFICSTESALSCQENATKYSQHQKTDLSTENGDCNSSAILVQKGPSNEMLICSMKCLTSEKENTGKYCDTRSDNFSVENGDWNLVDNSSSPHSWCSPKKEPESSDYHIASTCLKGNTDDTGVDEVDNLQNIDQGEIDSLLFDSWQPMFPPAKPLIRDVSSSEDEPTSESSEEIKSTCHTSNERFTNENVPKSEHGEKCVPNFVTENDNYVIPSQLYENFLVLKDAKCSICVEENPVYEIIQALFKEWESKCVEIVLVDPLKRSDKICWNFGEDTECVENRFSKLRQHDDEYACNKENRDSLMESATNVLISDRFDGMPNPSFGDTVSEASRTTGVKDKQEESVTGGRQLTDVTVAEHGIHATMASDIETDDNSVKNDLDECGCWKSLSNDARPDLRKWRTFPPSLGEIMRSLNSSKLDLTGRVPLSELCVLKARTSCNEQQFAAPLLNFVDCANYNTANGDYVVRDDSKLIDGTSSRGDFENKIATLCVNNLEAIRKFSEYFKTSLETDTKLREGIPDLNLDTDLGADLFESKVPENTEHEKEDVTSFICDESEPISNVDDMKNKKKSTANDNDSSMESTDAPRPGILKSALKRSKKFYRKKHRVQFDESLNKFFEADYVILVRDEQDFDDEYRCECGNQFCYEGCYYEDEDDDEEAEYENSVDSPRFDFAAAFDPPMEFVDPVTLSPPDGYKDGCCHEASQKVNTSTMTNAENQERKQKEGECCRGKFLVFL